MRSPCSLLQLEAVLAAGDVRRELVAVPTAVAAHVALERIAEAVAPHVDGEHDVVQKDHPAVAAGVHGPGHGLPVGSHHPQGLEGRQGDRLSVRVRHAVLGIQTPQQVTQAVHDRLGYLGAVAVEGVHADGRLGGMREAQERHA